MQDPASELPRIPLPGTWVNSVGCSIPGAAEVVNNLSLEDYFNDIEAQLESILRTLGPQLSPEDSQQVSHFLDVGEYGLALQTLTDLLIEERKKISTSTYNDIVRVAKRMGIEREVALEDLERRVHEDV